MSVVSVTNMRYGSVFTKRSKPQVSVAKSWLKAFDYSCIVFGVASVITGDPL